MNIKNLNNYGGALQDIHDNTFYINTTPTKKEKDVEDAVVVEEDTALLDKAQPYFERAIANNYMQKADKGYEWLKSQVLLSYFCGRIFCGDYIKPDKLSPTWKQGGEAFFPEKALANLFNSPNIGASRRNKVEGAPPKGYELIDSLFE